MQQFNVGEIVSLAEQPRFIGSIKKVQLAYEVELDGGSTQLVSGEDLVRAVRTLPASMLRFFIQETAQPVDFFVKCDIADKYGWPLNWWRVEELVRGTLSLSADATLETIAAMLAVLGWKIEDDGEEAFLRIVEASKEAEVTAQ